MGYYCPANYYYLLLKSDCGSQPRLTEQFLSSRDGSAPIPSDIVYFIVMHRSLIGGQVIFVTLSLLQLVPPKNCGWLEHS